MVIIILPHNIEVEENLISLCIADSDDLCPLDQLFPTHQLFLEPNIVRDISGDVMMM